MKNHDDPADTKLPVTAELGGEGGSYGDGAIQAETMNGVFGNPTIDAKRAGPAAGQASAAAVEGEQVLDADEEVRHATEPPEP
jgi:hypothetical protein